MEDSETRKTLSFAQRLASPSKKVREKGLLLLTKWLSSRTEVGEEEFKKIWKGLFYCLWHSDKVPVQIELSNSLAQIILEINTNCSLQYFSTFITTFRREWSGIDFYRLDKFYYCIRAFISTMFKLFSKHEWDSDIIKTFVECLSSKCLLVRDQYNALGVSLHLADIYIEEMQKCVGLPSKIIPDLIEPFYASISTASEKTLLQRIRERIFLRLFEVVAESKSQISALKDSTDSQQLQVGIGSLNLSSIADRLFEIASSSEIRQKNRTLLYELHEEFKRSLKKLEIPSSNNDSKTVSNHHDENASLNIQGNGSIKETPLDANLLNFSMDKEANDSAEEAKPEMSESPVIGKRKRKTNTEEVRKTIIDKMRIKKTNAKSTSSPTIDTNSSTEQFEQEVKKQDSSNDEVKIKVDQMDIDSNSSPSQKSKKKIKLKSKSSVQPTPNLTAVSISNPENSEVSKNDSESNQIKSEDENRASESPTTKKAKKKKKNSLTKSSPGQNHEESKVKSTPIQKNTDRKVHFSLESNLFFSKNGPVPPVCLRTPPNAAPRGSALKPGVKPGPINKKRLRV